MHIMQSPYPPIIFPVLISPRPCPLPRLLLLHILHSYSRSFYPFLCISILHSCCYIVYHTSYSIPHYTALHYITLHCTLSLIRVTNHLTISLTIYLHLYLYTTPLCTAAHSKTQSVVLVNGVDEMLKKGKTTCAALKAAIDGALTILITDATKAKSNMTSSCDKVSESEIESLREDESQSVSDSTMISLFLYLSYHSPDITSSFLINHSSRLTWVSPTVTWPRL